MTLIRYTTGTVKNCESGRSPREARPDFFWARGGDDGAEACGSGWKPQAQKASKRSLAKAKQAKFLSVLADTCNVREAARRAGVSNRYIYEKRKTDAAFRAGWIEAIGIAYQRLELVLLERAFNGTEKIVQR